MNVRSEIQTGDEFEDLRHAFNRMLRNLVSMQDRLRKVNADLDLKVDELAQARPKRHFTVGIMDDVTHLSLAYDPDFDIEADSVVRAVFYGLGADGTVGANKNSIKIIGEDTPNYAQGYFVYDSKKSGAMTVSHLRFGPQPIRSPYLINSANFVACHQFGFLEKVDVLEMARPGGVFLLNSPFRPA